MSCNGNNHDLFCPCEFRGGHGQGASARNLPSRVSLLENLSYTSLAGSSYESYLDVNAKCPECGDPVIFYRSSHDGRVFFDPPPGYPWPKHPCTDSLLKGKAFVRTNLHKLSLLDPSWDWFIFRRSTQIKDWEWSSIEMVLGEEYLRGDRDVRFVPRRQNVIATEIRGQLIILRRKSKIKVIKRNQKPTDEHDIEYEYNDSYQLTLRLEGYDNRVNAKIARLKNCAISAKLGIEGAVCTLACVPLHSANSEGEKFELSARVTRMKRRR